MSNTKLQLECDKSKFNLHVKNHIYQLVTRFKGKVDMWDVVNEALNDDGTLRKTVFLDMFLITHFLGQTR